MNGQSQMAKNPLTKEELPDARGGANDHMNAFGRPQPPQVREAATDHERAQWGADVRAEPLPGPVENPPLPEGLRKTRTGPLNKRTRRNPTS